MAGTGFSWRALEEDRGPGPGRGGRRRRVLWHRLLGRPASQSGLYVAYGL